MVTDVAVAAEAGDMAAPIPATRTGATRTAANDSRNNPRDLDIAVDIDITHSCRGQSIVVPVPTGADVRCPVGPGPGSSNRFNTHVSAIRDPPGRETYMDDVHRRRDQIQ